MEEDKLQKHRRTRPDKRWSRRVSTLLGLGLFSILSCSYYLSRLTLEERGRAATVPLHAVESLQKCHLLDIKPGPPTDFNDRSASDRFQPGTKPILIKNASIWTGRLQGLEVIKGDLLLDQGLIQAVGHVHKDDLDSFDGLVTVDAKGAWITPGIIDVHSHLGVGSSPELSGAADGNSFRGPILPWLRSLDGINTHDKGYASSISGGVTTSLVLPGSANAIGGQAFVIKLRPTQERSPSAMLLEPPFGYNGSGTPGSSLRWRHMKHACGENPARVYGDTRMDTTWAYRQAYDKARQIKLAQDEYCAKALNGDWKALKGRDFPDDFQWEALVDVLRGRVKVQTHCYEATDFDNFLRLSREFQFPVAAFHHAHEAYLVPDLLKRAYEHPPAIAMFSTFARYKREAYRHSEFAPRILADSGMDVIMKSDHPAIVSRYLVNEAAQAHYYGLADNVALASVTTTPAKVLGLGHRIGYLKEGYDADLVIWDSHPLALGATPTQVIIDGIVQLPSSYTVDKPASQQHVPNTPNFDKEARDAVKFEGLPPLIPDKSTAELIIFINVSSVWIARTPGQDIFNAFESANHQEPTAGVVVVRDGTIICHDSNSKHGCANFTTLGNILTVNLQGGALQPGLISVGSSLGLQEIAMESSTVNGKTHSPLLADPPSIVGGASYLPRAVDGLQYSTRDALLAYRSGVTVGITPPSHSTFFSGLSTAFSLVPLHRLEHGAVVQDIVALHVAVSLGDMTSVSTQIATLRRLLLDPINGENGRWFRKVVNGTLPLVVEVNSADIIATLIQLKKEVELESGNRLRMTLVGGTEAHLLAKELGEADVGIVLTPPRPYPYTWDHRRVLPGPPVTKRSAIAHLIANNVTVGLGPQGTSAMSEISAWAVRNLRFDAAWALLESPDVLTQSTALALASSNIEKLFGLDVAPGEGDLVATAGGELLSFEGKVVAVISPRRGKVDVF